MAAVQTVGKAAKELRAFQGVRLKATVTEHLRLGQDGIQAMEVGSQGVVVWLEGQVILVPWNNVATVRFVEYIPLPKE